MKKIYILMENKLLLPNGFKKPGWFIMVPAMIAGVFLSFHGYEADWLNVKVFALFDSDFNGSRFCQFIDDNITNELVGLLFLTGAFFVAFSKEKTEDEFIAKLRLSSLLWAVCVNYVLLFLTFIFVYGLSFYSMMIYNMFTVLIFFIVRFNYILYRNSKTMQIEK